VGYSRCRYLTARCPSGCECWLHPRAVSAHLQPGRCQGRPWTDRVPNETLVPAPVADVVRGILDPPLVRLVMVSQDRILGLRSSEYVRDEVLQGIVVRSPLEGVKARRWVSIVLAALDRHGPLTVKLACTPAGFVELETTFDRPHSRGDCPHCGQKIPLRTMKQHQARNTLCRWQRAAHAVRTLWADGWRDPFVIPSAPLRWDELQRRAYWRRRTQTVVFPRWVAVLILPPDDAPSA
jgi:hypothetical protein